MVRWKLGLFLWTFMSVYPGISSDLVRQRRILNEPGDAPPSGSGVIPSNKRQQIIYLLNKSNANKRDQQPVKMSKMEKLGKELTVDGRVVTMTTLPSQVHSFAFYGPSEELHGRGFKEVEVNKGDGPPKLANDKTATSLVGKEKPAGAISAVTSPMNKNQAGSLKRQQISNTVQRTPFSLPGVPLKSSSSGLLNALKPEAKMEAPGVQKSVVTVTSGTSPSVTASTGQQLSSKAEEIASKSRIKNSDIRFGRLPDGEILLPHKRIEPNVFSISQSDVSSSDGFSRDEISPNTRDHNTVLIPGEEPPDRGYGRWGDVPTRRYHHHYRHRSHRPMVLSSRPNMYYMPMYSGHSQLPMIPFTAGEGMPAEPPGDAPPLQGYPAPGYRRQVLLQPMVQLPVVQPQQGVPFFPGGSPFVSSPYGQPDVRPALLAAMPATPQLMYSMPALPTVPDPQQEMPPDEQPFAREIEQQRELEDDRLQRQREMEQREFQSAQAQESHFPLATNWVDEPGRARSSVDQVPRPERFPEDRPDDDRYLRERYYDHADNARGEERYHGFRDDYDDGRLGRFRDDARYHGGREEEEVLPREPEEEYRGPGQDYRGQGQDYRGQGQAYQGQEYQGQGQEYQGQGQEYQGQGQQYQGQEYRGQGQQYQGQPEEERPFGEENASVRSTSPEYIPRQEDSDDDDDDDEEAESEDSQAALQDSREEPLEQEEKPVRPPAIEPPELPLQPEPPLEPPPGFEPPPGLEPPPGFEPKMQKVSPFEGMMPRVPSSSSEENEEAPAVIRIPDGPDSHLMRHPMRYHHPFAANTFERGQLLGEFSPARPKVLPHMPYYPMPRESTRPDVSEMSESEARFKERMNMEMEAGAMPMLTSKDKIPKGNSLGDLKNTIIRLNGKPLETGSELRSRIIHGRIVRGKGKLITSKGPIHIKLSHTKGPKKMKIIDIISPQQFHVSDARSSIGRAKEGRGSSSSMSKGIPSETGGSTLMPKSIPSETGGSTTMPKSISSETGGSTSMSKDIPSETGTSGTSGSGDGDIIKSNNVKRIKADENLDRVASIIAARLLRKNPKGKRTLKADLEKLK